MMPNARVLAARVRCHHLPSNLLGVANILGSMHMSDIRCGTVAEPDIVSKGILHAMILNLISLKVWGLSLDICTCICTCSL